MSQDIEKAAKLAERAYSVQVVTDETTDGMPIYLARIAELDGCMAQGETIEQALENLRGAKIDFIASLLEDGLPVPCPTFGGHCTFRLNGSRQPVLGTSLIILLVRTLQ